MSTTTSRVILNGMEDWDDWIEVIRAAAIGADIWDLINPNSGIPKVLEEPKRPEPRDVHPENPGLPPTPFSALSTDEKEQLRTLQFDYSYDRKAYDRKKRALANVRIRIIESIKRDYFSCTHNCETVYDILVKLKDRFSPMDKIREQELIEDYRKVGVSPKAQGIDT
jgi:hypothetical protein